MPGSISSAAPATVMPWSLCKSFTHSREYVVNGDDYKNGESDRGRLTETSRKLWKLSQRLTPVLLARLRDFYDAQNGPLRPFYFYDVWETAPKFAYDETGTETIGRYVVRFEDDWSQSIGLGRGDAGITLMEII